MAYERDESPQPGPPDDDVSSAPDAPSSSPTADQPTTEHPSSTDQPTTEISSSADQPTTELSSSGEQPAIALPSSAEPPAAGDAARPAVPPGAGDPGALRDWPAGDTRETRVVGVTADRRQPDALPSADFPVVWRGYDAHAVDAYVEAAEAALDRYAEQTLPTVAVQRALDRIGEQTASILREAEQAAEETARVSRAHASDRLERAEREAAEVRETAHARVRDLDDDIERLWQERQRLIDATRELSERLRLTAEEAEARFPPAAEAAEAAAEPALGPRDERPREGPPPA